MAVTAAADLDHVVSVTRKLNDLLDEARQIKPEQTVEPPLPTAPLTGKVDSLHDGVSKQHDQAYRSNCVETAARQMFYAVISSIDIQYPAFVEVWNLLDILLLCGDRGQCAAELVCWLLEELLDSQTTHGCRVVFDYLESRKERLVRKDFHKKNLVFLRSCNELLRRLSRAEDAIFCGRVFFFLFQTFPLGDKSSVNLRGEYHTENTTKFEIPEADNNQQNGEQMEIDSISAPKTAPVRVEAPQPSIKAGSKAGPAKAHSKKVEEEALSTSDLYPIFWRLQQDFSDPTRLFEEENFEAFKKGLAHTILKFKKTPTVVQAKTSDDNRRGAKRKHGADGVEMIVGSDDVNHFADNYNPKYLTSRDLFDLELSDMAFQRHILVQSLILIDFLLSLSDKAKKRLASPETINKSMLYQFTLSEDGARWATTTRSTITSYMSSTLEGKLFNRMVETVLARDKNWIRWKIEGCPTIVRDPVSTESEAEARKGAQNATRIRRLPDKPMGAIGLAFLEEGRGGLDALKDPSRYTPPSIESLIEGTKGDELDLEMAMDDEEKVSLENAMANKRWRILRQARMTRLELLDKVLPDQNIDSVFLPASDGDDTGVVAVSSEAEEGGEVQAAEDAETTIVNGEIDVEKS